MVDFLQYMLWMAFWALILICVLWPVSMFFLAFVGLAYAQTFPPENRKLEMRHFLLLLPALPIALLLLAGTVYRNEQDHGYIVQILFIAEVVFCACVVALLKGIRVFATWFCLWLLWCSLWVAWIALMSIRNAWLNSSL